MAIKRWMGLLLAGSSLASVTHSSKVAARTTDAAADFVDDLIADLSAALYDHQTRALQCVQEPALVVNTGYAKYRGYYDSASALNHGEGCVRQVLIPSRLTVRPTKNSSIQYSQAPTGSLRWQPPRFPALAPSAPVTDTDAYGNQCYQHYLSLPGSFPFPGGNKDCLS
ncbi:hypothetical protein QBC40DRAFT_263595 [Triangularia verruculosa]|uniref:Uncharacterized protein n=1 Tax=Triangularia verruculosa TaxID=2587418 RepID=A0AAN6XKP2_9PEZI|nr:hypothetical protein QBC40DRAFT_263595 [Triangularia verruculosa]